MEELRPAETAPTVLTGSHALPANHHAEQRDRMSSVSGQSPCDNSQIQVPSRSNLKLIFSKYVNSR